MRFIPITLIAVAVFAVGMRWNTFAIGGSDSYCYAHQAQGWASGTILAAEPLVREAPFPYPPEPLRTWAIRRVTRDLRRLDAGGSPSLLLRALDRLGIGFSS